MIYKSPFRSQNRFRFFLNLLLALLFINELFTSKAQAIPAFARKFEQPCSMCHQFHFPLLNSFGKKFRDNGYQFPKDIEATFKEQRMIKIGDDKSSATSIFREVPLSFRMQGFNLISKDPNSEKTDDKTTTTSINSYMMGGGSVAKDISVFFSWSPFPTPTLHQGKIGFHNILSETIGDGTLNFRMGTFFLLDLQRPTHRTMAEGRGKVGTVTVGNNNFALDNSTSGFEFYGNPFLGPFHYELALVAGDPGDNVNQGDRDAHKDAFGRLSYVFLKDSGHEVTTGLFSYNGKSIIDNKTSGVEIIQVDKFTLTGGDLELDLGKLNIFGMAYQSKHSDAVPEGNELSYKAMVGEVLFSVTQQVLTGARYEIVTSEDAAIKTSRQIEPHVNYSFAENVLGRITYRRDLIKTANSDYVVSFDVAF